MLNFEIICHVLIKKKKINIILLIFIIVPICLPIILIVSIKMNKTH